MHFAVEGTIVRKRKVGPSCTRLALQEDCKSVTTTVFIPRRNCEIDLALLSPAGFNFLYLGCVVRCEGTGSDEDGHRNVTRCTLIKSAGNVKLIKDVLSLDNYLSFAPSFDMTGDELRALKEGSKEKAAVHSIIERVTGKSAKVPVKYRPARVRRRDMEILERMEARGANSSSSSGECSDDGGTPRPWSMCVPCHQLSDVLTFEPRQQPSSEPIRNLPDGLPEQTISNHGKLTRGEYLDGKKDRQAEWFVARLKRFDPPPRRIVDVGGGRGDLAVAVASSLPSVEVVVVDCNGSSVEAGRDYARIRGVADRIEFLTMTFGEYLALYNSAGNPRGVDFVMALHACGDLSDQALSFAEDNKLRFVVCPCCYCKRYLRPFRPAWRGLCGEDEADALTRLVELDDHRDVSIRAMTVVNSMRKGAFRQGGRGGGNGVKLEVFDGRMSRRNFVLVGE